MQSDQSRTSYDFIVCGAGSSGCVVAARLAENPDVRVLLIEAGGDDDVPEVTAPDSWTANLGSERDWGFHAQPNPHLNGRAIPLSMGKVLGGGSSINSMVWARGHKNDWEHFAVEAGDPAWGYEAILGVYRRIENWQGASDPGRRGVNGPVYVQSAADPQPIAVAMIEAAQAWGLPCFDSPNGAMMEGRGGVAVNDLIVCNGRRVSIFRSYVQPKRHQKNLTVLTDTLIDKLILRGFSVTGVEVIKNGKRQCYYADREVVLSLGAVNTPKVLMQSGIGPEAELRRHAIRVRQHLPGVGQNHQDHVSVGCIFEYIKPQPFGNGGAEATLYWSSDGRLNVPDMFHSQFEFPAPSAEIASLGVPTHGWTMFAGLAHPKSRGSIRLSGPNVEDPVLIDANTLSHPEDLKSVVANIKTCRELGAHSALGGLVRREAYPGKSSSEALHAYARSAAVTYRHQSCTAKMGRDQMSVVDNQLHVYGIGKLRVADASIMPTITTGNTMAPCVVIGERAADMIRCSHGI